MKCCTDSLAENIKPHQPAEGNNKSVILKSSYNVRKIKVRIKTLSIERTLPDQYAARNFNREHASFGNKSC